MKIPTIVEANRVSECCGCGWPVCDAPRKECETITVDYVMAPIASADGVYYSSWIYSYTGWENSDGSGPFHNYGPPPDYVTYPDDLTQTQRIWSRSATGTCVSADSPEPTPSLDSLYPDGFLISSAETHDYSSPFTLADFYAAILVDFAAIPFDSDCAGSTCASTFSVSFGEESPRLTKCRYRFGVPSDYSTVDVPRSTWEMTWDLVLASDEWWLWYDGGMFGEEPTPAPTSTPHEWIWGGSMASPFSDWYEIPLPEIGFSHRTANVMITCWKSSRLGNKPTAYGDQVALP